jgi:NAD(P)-dependent dehydrogenase (short-subunit alcohol dehydrogenase family)
VLASRTAERLKDVSMMIRSRNGKALPVTADVTEKDDVRRLVKTTVAEFGKIDILVNHLWREIRTCRWEFQQMTSLAVCGPGWEALRAYSTACLGYVHCGPPLTVCECFLASSQASHQSS